MSDERRVHRPFDPGDLDLDPRRSTRSRPCAPRCRARPRSGVGASRDGARAARRECREGESGRRWWATGTSGSNDVERTRSRAVRTRSSRAPGRGRPARPGRTWRSVTVPSIGAATTCSIFIASRVTIGSPAATTAPTATWTVRTDAGHRGDHVRRTAAGRLARPPRGPRDRRPAGRPAGTARFDRRCRRGPSPSTTTDVEALRRARSPRSSGSCRRPRAGRVDGPFRRQPPAHGSALVPGRSAVAAARPGVVGDRGAVGPVVRRPDPVQRVRPRLAGQHHRLADEPAEEPQVRDDPEDERLVQRQPSGARTPPPDRDRARRSSPASGRTASRPRCRARSRHRRGCRRRSASAGLRCGRSRAGSRPRHPRRRGGLRRRGRVASMSSCANPSGSPAAIRSWSATRSRPVTASVTGCSTWRRVFISRKAGSPRSVMRNSQVPALT